MTENDLISDAIERATKEVFETMLGAEAQRMEGNKPSEPEPGVVSLVGLTGDWSGTGTVSCSPGGARLVAERMLLLELNEGDFINDDVLDAVAELTNMIVGNIKNILSENFGEMAISIPTVIHGRNFKFKNLAGMTELIGVFQWEQHRFDVKVCLAPTLEKTAAPRFTAPAVSLH